MRPLKQVVDAKAPEIMIALGIGSFFTAIYLAAKAAPRANGHIEDLDDRSLPNKIATAAPIYAPAAGAALLGTGMILMANHIQVKRYASVLALYSLTETALGRWQEKALETIGEKKFEEVRRQVVAPEHDDIPDNMLLEEHGVVVWDHQTSKYFKVGSIEEIHAAVNKINKQALDEDFASLNDFYYELDMPPVPYGDSVGWGNGGHLLEISLDPYIRKDGVIPVSLSFKVEPKRFSSY
jgi:hypothetical protein